MAQQNDFRSGFVAVIGRPNVGKSTLLNTILERKVAIVTPHPQTTRTHLLGIYDAPATASHPAGQIVFVDTPGIHKARTPLNREMLRHVRAALEGRNLALLVVDVTRRSGAEDAYAMEILRQAAEVEAKHGAPPRMEAPAFEGEAPAHEPAESAAAEESGGLPLPVTFLVLNKIDRWHDKRGLLPLIAGYRERFPFAEIIPVSARTGDQVPVLIDRIMAYLPTGPRYFPAGAVTDQSEQFWIAELIREKAMLATRNELPHAMAVQLETFDLGPQPHIAATIYCERPGQKAILIGRHGEMIKRIGSEARAEIEAALGERLHGRNLFLELRVEVHPAWRGDARFLKALDWREAPGSLLTDQ